MTDLFSAAQAADAAPDGAVALAPYAERAYLEYALSVVKGRALPDVCDGQKPVQRRILYAMQRMGLAFAGAGGPKPVKSARIVGDVLGNYHPHGDQPTYDALVRMAQDFSLRYPLVDGQGNFGSRDGDGAAAMRYTEARLTPITDLLLDEIDEDTVDFVPNYDGSTEEPRLLPARLPFLLLNGATGVAVGMATEVPAPQPARSRRRRRRAAEEREARDDELYALIPGPDFPGRRPDHQQRRDDPRRLRQRPRQPEVRARWKIEDLARGQWQLVVTELPPGTSTQKVIEEIEELTNPKLKAGKKALSAEQLQLKRRCCSVLDKVNDESDKETAVRLVLEPSAHVAQAELITTLLAHTSLEGTSPINLTCSASTAGRRRRTSARCSSSGWRSGSRRSRGAPTTGSARSSAASTSSKAACSSC